MRVAFKATQCKATLRQNQASLRLPAASLQLLSRPHSRPWHLTTISLQRRGGKSKATLQLEELPREPPQGQKAILHSQDEGPAYPPVVQQVWNNMQKFEGCVVLTRIGNFYEVRWQYLGYSSRC